MKLTKKLLGAGVAIGVMLTFSFGALATDSEEIAEFSARGEAMVKDMLAETAPITAVEEEAGDFSLSAYSDINGHWAKEYIDFVTGESLFNGTSDTTFSPDAYMTRAMFVTVLGRFAGVDEKAYQNSSFSDVPLNQWYSPYVQWANANKIVEGFEDKTFRPNDNVTREQMATLINRFRNFAQITLITICDNYRFNDEDEISQYAKDSVRITRITGLLTGNNLRFMPQSASTRAEVATVMTRLVRASRGERIYVNYGKAAVPVYTSVTGQPCVATNYSDRTQELNVYDINGTGFVYYYVESELTAYREHLVTQGFILAGSRTEGDDTVLLYSKGDIVTGIFYNERYVIITPNVYESQE